MAAAGCMISLMPPETRYTAHPSACSFLTKALEEKSLPDYHSIALQVLHNPEFIYFSATVRKKCKPQPITYDLHIKVYHISAIATISQLQGGLIGTQ